MRAHSTIRNRFSNGHMVFRGDRRVDTHTHTHHRARRHPGGTSVDSHEVALPSHQTKSTQARLPARADTHGSSPTAGEFPRAAAHQSAPRDCLPTHSRHHDDGRPHTPPMLVGDPVPYRRPAQPHPTQRGTTDPPIPSTGPARRRTPASDLFHEPEAQPKIAATRIPPRVTVRGHRPAPGRPQVIQAGNRLRC